MARPSSLVNEAVAAAGRGAEALEPLLQSAGMSMQVTAFTSPPVLTLHLHYRW